MDDKDERPRTGQYLRDDAREIAVLRVARLTTGRGEQLCRIRNISPKGVMAEVPGAYWVGETASIELKGGGQAQGRIAWVEKGRIGVAFNDLVDPHTLLAVDPAQADRLIRIAVSATATLCLESRFQSVTVEDISLGGARIRLDLPDCLGARVVLTVPDMASVSGSIRWHSPPHAGIAFDTPLAVEQLCLWLESLK